MNDLAKAAADIEAVVRAYLDGMVFADAAKLRRAFHPRACVVGHYDGALEWLTLDEFVASCEAAGAAKPGTEYYWEILSADVTGDTTVLKIACDYQGARFTDYLSILEIDGRRQITHKAYFHHAAAAPAN